jgi:hypothetical protein
VAAGGPFFFTLLSFLFFFFRGKVFVVRCLVGPPNGLNIRNLLWHGFLDPEQLHPALLGIAAAAAATTITPPSPPPVGEGKAWTRWFATVTGAEWPGVPLLAVGGVQIF